MIKSIKEIRDELKYVSSPELIDSILKEWGKNIVQSAIDKIESQPTSYPPEEGEDDYGPGKYMTIGMLYEFKNEIK